MTRSIRVERHRSDTWLLIPPDRVSTSSDGTVIAKLSMMDLIQTTERLSGAMGGALIFAMGTRDPERDHSA